jgi:hypothetical protein
MKIYFCSSLYTRLLPIAGVIAYFVAAVRVKIPFSLTIPKSLQQISSIEPDQLNRARRSVVFENFNAYITQVTLEAANCVVLIDGDNVRGKTKFRVSKEELYESVRHWASATGAPCLGIILFFDHGKEQCAFMRMDSGVPRGIAVCFSGPREKADDMIVSALPILQSSLNCSLIAIVVTEDTELKKRCRRCTRGAGSSRRRQGPLKLEGIEGAVTRQRVITVESTRFVEVLMHSDVLRLTPGVIDSAPGSKESDADFVFAVDPPGDEIWHPQGPQRQKKMEETGVGFSPPVWRSQKKNRRMKAGEPRSRTRTAAAAWMAMTVQSKRVGMTVEEEADAARVERTQTGPCLSSPMRLAQRRYEARLAGAGEPEETWERSLMAERLRLALLADPYVNVRGRLNDGGPVAEYVLRLNKERKGAVRALTVDTARGGGGRVR